MSFLIAYNENNKTRMEKTEQLKSILTDLDNRELTKHQAHDLICVLFSVVGQSEQLKPNGSYYTECKCGNMVHARDKNCKNCGL